MPSGLIQSLFSMKNLLPKMYSVCKNSSQESCLGEMFLSTLLIFENNFFVIQGVRINPEGGTELDFNFSILKRNVRGTRPRP